MVGRRRRTSDSTTGTLDPDGQSYFKELQVLKKYDPAADGPDGMLQTFVLEDAVVCDKTGRPVELFTVKTKGPFTVRGRVVLEPWQKSRALKSTTSAAWIETKDCVRYAIGQDIHNNYGAWASGQAGWYELRPPSAAYKAIYDHTIEGVTIYYMVMHVIEDHKEAQEAKRGKKGSKKRGKKSAPSQEELTIDTLLFKYAVAVGDGATYDEVVARCDDHAPFLISHFYEAANEFDWPPTVFFKWLVERHPDIHEDVLASRKKRPTGARIKQEIPEETEAIASPVPTDEPPVQKALSRRRQRTTPQETNLANDEVDTRDFALPKRSVRSRSRGKTKTQSRSPPPTQPPIDPMDVDENVDENVDETSETPLAETEDDQAAKRSNVDLVLDALGELEPELMPLNTAAFSKVSSKLYYKCKIKAYHSAAEIFRYYAAEIWERLRATEWAGSGFLNTLQAAANAPRIQLQHVTVDQIPAVLVRRKTVTRNLGKAVKTNTGQSEAHKEAVVETPPPKRPGRPAGKRSALRPGRPGSKRHADETPETVSRKAAKISHAYDSDEDEHMNNASSSDADSSELDATESPIPLRVVVRAENIQTTDPTGPNGTWVCDEEGCGFVVRNPDQEQGRELIQEHLQDAHYLEDENRDERIDLALTEGVKNHLPIDHLLEKIRAMGQKVQAKDEVKINDDIAPQPIKRRLIS